MNPLMLSEKYKDGVFAGVIIMMLIGLPLSLILSTNRQNTKTNAQTPVQVISSAPPSSDPTPTAPMAAPTSKSAAAGAAKTITLNPVADAYVDNATSMTRTRNYGTITVMNVNGGPESIAYLRFDLTQLMGRTVTDAVLRVRTGTDTSYATQTIRPVSNTTWGETTINYNNRPAVTNISLGMIDSQDEPHAWQEVDLTNLANANAGKQFSVAINATDNNNIWFWSRESTSSPELVIKYR